MWGGGGAEECTVVAAVGRMPVSVAMASAGLTDSEGNPSVALWVASCSATAREMSSRSSSGSGSALQLAMSVRLNTVESPIKRRSSEYSLVCVCAIARSPVDVCGAVTPRIAYLPVILACWVELGCGLLERCNRDCNRWRVELNWGQKIQLARASLAIELAK